MMRRLFMAIDKAGRNHNHFHDEVIVLMYLPCNAAYDRGNITACCGNGDGRRRAWRREIISDDTKIRATQHVRRDGHRGITFQHAIALLR